MKALWVAVAQDCPSAKKRSPSWSASSSSPGWVLQVVLALLQDVLVLAAAGGVLPRNPAHRGTAAADRLGIGVRRLRLGGVDAKGLRSARRYWHAHRRVASGREQVAPRVVGGSAGGS